MEDNKQFGTGHLCDDVAILRWTPDQIELRADD